MIIIHAFTGDTTTVTVNGLRLRADDRRLPNTDDDGWTNDDGGGGRGASNDGFAVSNVTGERERWGECSADEVGVVFPDVCLLPPVSLPFIRDLGLRVSGPGRVAATRVSDRGVEDAEDRLLLRALCM